MKSAGLLLLLLLGILMPPRGLAQRKVDPRNTFHRVWAVVPLVGAGTMADPKRPLYAPAPGVRGAAQRQGICGFSSILSDDGKFALVELVAVDRAALNVILKDTRTDVKKFEKGKDREEDIVREFRKYKKDFDPKMLGGGF